MLGNKIDNLLMPTINYYDSNEPNFFPDIYQMTEKTSNFENIINEMKINTKKKFSLKNCSNPNCMNPFSGDSNCTKCNDCLTKYCPNCIKKCQNCVKDICIFCITIKYGSNGDIELCRECAQTQ